MRQGARGQGPGAWNWGLGCICKINKQNICFFVASTVILNGMLGKGPGARGQGPGARGQGPGAMGQAWNGMGGKGVTLHSIAWHGKAWHCKARRSRAYDKVFQPE